MTATAYIPAAEYLARMRADHEHTPVHTTCGWCGEPGHTAARCPQR